MKKLIIFICLGVFADAKPSYPIHPGVGAIYKGPNSETIIEGPDGSIITAEANGGVVGVEGDGGALAAHASVAVGSTASHQIIDNSVAVAAAAAASHSRFSHGPIVVQEPLLVAEPVLVANDQAALEGPSGAILRHGENAVISGPASTTIREGRVISSIPHADLHTGTLVAAQPVIVESRLVAAPGVGVNVAEANAHLSDIDLINQANFAAQISESNRATLAEAEFARINTANAAALAAEANRAALVGAKIHLSSTVAPHLSFNDVNAINSAALAHSQEAVARANLEAHLSHTVTPQVTIDEVNAANFAHSQQALAQANFAHSQQAIARDNLAHSQRALAQANFVHSQQALARDNLAHSQQALAQANLGAQFSHTVTPQVTVADVNAINAANLVHSQEAYARANLEGQFSHGVAPQVTTDDIHAINAANLAHSQETISRANLEAELTARAQIAQAQAQAIEHNRAVKAGPLRLGLNPIITQGNQIVSDGIISSTAVPVSTVSPIFSSTIAPTHGYLVKELPAQNVIVSSTIKPVPGYLANVDTIPIISQPRAVFAPVQAINGGQAVYQSSHSSSSQAVSHSSSSSQSSSSNIVNGGLGGVAGVVGGSLAGAPLAVSNSDLAQWQASFANSAHNAGTHSGALSSQSHRGVFH